MRSTSTLVLQRSEVARLLSLDDCIAAVEEAFRLRGEGRISPGGTMSEHFPGGGFHIKTALTAANDYFVAKLNGNFPSNPKQHGLPTIQGVIVLCDGNNGSPLAVMDSIEVTILRTGAATAVAAKFLARKDAATATICGCGNQGRVQLRALTRVLPIRRAYAFDVETAAAEKFACDMSAELKVDIRATTSVADAVSASDVCVTCTPSSRFFVTREMVKAGTFVAGVGADNPAKQELDPTLLANARLATDDAMQCAMMGDFHHAIVAGLLTGEQCSELGEVVAGMKSGRESDNEITIFDSTGVAFEDLAAATIVYQRAMAEGVGIKIDFSA
jgi:alanine dehydrogenase